jgi:hypothetical protein
MAQAHFKKTHFVSVVSALVVAMLPAVVACGAAEEADKSPAPSGSKSRDKGEDQEETTTTTTNPDQSIGDPVPATPPADTPPAAPLIYAHTKDTLYTFEAATKKVTEVGKLACLSATDRLLDIAVDGKGAVFGTTDEAFLSINPKDGTCTRIIAKDNLPNSLSFVPAGTLEAGAEALVGYAFDTANKAVRYVQINTTTGAVTEIGLLNPTSATKKYVSSGDVFSIANDANRAFLTVHEDGVADGPDQLAEIDPKTGKIKSIVGNTLQADIYGLAYWSGKAYGFSGDGNVTEINVVTGVSNTVAKLEKDAVAVPWFGAGVTTAAPVTK